MQTISDTKSKADYELTVAVPMLQREHFLKRLLQSAETNSAIDRVVVADNGKPSWREMYDQDWNVGLEVINLEYDAGLGACRHALVSETVVDKLVIVDNDMVIPRNIHVLAELLQRGPKLGAVSGIVAEHGYLRGGVTDLREFETLTGKQAILQEQIGDRQLLWDEYPIATADKITHAMVIQRDCVEDYCWDPDLKNGTHLDFALGHYHTTDWKFAVTPSVIFQHFTQRENDGSTYYNTFRYGNQERMNKWDKIVLDKWGYDTMVWGDSYWFNTKTQPFAERMWKAIAAKYPLRYTLPVKRFAERIL